MFWYFLSVSYCIFFDPLSMINTVTTVITGNYGQITLIVVYKRKL